MIVWKWQPPFSGDLLWKTYHFLIKASGDKRLNYLSVCEPGQGFKTFLQENVFFKSRVCQEGKMYSTIAFSDRFDTS